MTTWQAMAALEAAGYRFSLEGGNIHARAAEEAPEASALLEIARRDREAARAYVLERQDGACVMEDGSTYSVLEALAIAQAVRKGEARLFGKVIFHRPAGTVSVYWESLTDETAEALLNRYKEALQNALEARLTALEGQDYSNSSAEEREAYCRQYERYLAVLELQSRPSE